MIKSISRTVLGIPFRKFGIALLVLGTFLGGQLDAQPRGRATEQEYHLKSAPAAEVARGLKELFAGLPEKARVELDKRTNTVKVTGSEKVHRLAGDLIERLDQARVYPAQNKVVFRSYRVEAAGLSDLAADLESRFATDNETRIAVDDRTSQLLVLAPAAVHEQIATLVAEHEAPSNADRKPSPVRSKVTRTPKAAARAPRQPDPPGEANVQLSRLPPADFTSALTQLWGDRLHVVSQPNEASTHFRLEMSNDARLDIEFNRRTGKVVVQGPARLAKQCAHLISVLDDDPGDAGRTTRIVPINGPISPELRAALAAVQSGGKGPPATAVARATRGSAMVARLFQPRLSDEDENGQTPEDSDVEETEEETDDESAGQEEMSDDEEAPEEEMTEEEMQAEQQRQADEAAAAEAEAGDDALISEVQIEELEGLESLIIRGNERDVQRVLEIIEEIERIAAETQPFISVYPLEHVGSQAMADTIRPLYDEVLSPRQGRVSITALVKPNAVLLIGREESVQSVQDLIDRLDQPVGPVGQFRVFRLRHQPAGVAAATITQFFAERTSLGAKVLVTADYRTNSLIVQASPRDLVEVARLIKNIDTNDIPAENEIRVIKLTNALAEELAPLLQEAVNSQAGRGAGGQQGQFGQQGGQQFFPQQGQAGQGQQGAQNQAAAQQQKSFALKFMTIDADGQRQVKSGILTDVRVTADTRANALVVSAPGDSMELLLALIAQLDQAPAALAQIKVFTVVNGDAESLVELLENLFGGGGGQGGQGQGQLGQQQLVSGGEGSLLPLRFSVDPRTNSIIASGSSDDLAVVEAILFRLDESDVRQRKSTVYRLKNAPADAVAESINEYLRSERQVQQTTPGLLSPFEQIEREVVVVPEIVSNSLVISATPRYYDEILKLVKELDARPPMVMIQVLIGEIALNNTDEFGIELGLQDSVLFDRSLVGDLITTSVSTTQSVAGGGTIATQDQRVLGASNTPGFVWNNLPLGNSASDRALAQSGRVGGQGLSSFSLGRTNQDLGFGGLVLSASSESVSLLVRALKESRRLEVLSRPQIMTLDNQPALINVGQRVPYTTGTTVTPGVGQTNNVELLNVGLILGVRPRISPDGMVVMEIDAEKSVVGPEAEGVPISIAANGDVLRQPRIDTTFAQTTISAMDGQTVVFAGLITKSNTQLQRRVPLLSEVPILGHLFRYDGSSTRKTELLIIMTPRIVRNEAHARQVARDEAARISWCLSDVRKIHGETGLRGRMDEWTDAETMTIYPDSDPLGDRAIPAGDGTPELAPREGEMLPHPDDMPSLPPTDRRNPAPRGSTPNDVEEVPGAEYESSMRQAPARDGNPRAQPGMPRAEPGASNAVEQAYYPERSGPSSESE